MTLRAMTLQQPVSGGGVPPSPPTTKVKARRQGASSSFSPLKLTSETSKTQSIRLRTAVWLLIGTLAMASAFVFVRAALSATSSGGIVVGPGVVFRPSGSWADLRFTSQQTFQSEVIVGATGVSFDGVALDVVKLPQTLPRASVNITTWAPSAGNGTTAIELVVTSDPNSTVWLNASGLRNDAIYNVYVDGVWQRIFLTLGNVSFPWATWSSHTIDFRPLIVGAPIIDTTPPAATTDLRATGWGTDFATLGWTAPGNNGTVGQASTYDIRYSTKPLNATNFGNATPIPTGRPHVAGTPETVNVTGLSPNTTYWFALRTADAVPNWSPLSSIVKILTLLSYEGVPSINGVAYDPTVAQVQLTFSEPMNTTSVEQALNVTPSVPFEVTWASDTQLTIRIQASLTTGTTYRVTIQPHAAANTGIPMARTFDFEFGALSSGETQLFFGFPAGLVYFLLADLAVLALVTSFAFTRLVRSQHNVRKMQAAMIALARRMSSLVYASRGKRIQVKIAPPKVAARRGLSPFRGRK